MSMMRPVVSIGQVYGRLTVLEFAGTRFNYRTYKCRCACGELKIARGVDLAKGYTRSCGCLARETAKRVGQGGNRRLANGEACFHQLVRRYEVGARKRKLVFELTREQVKELTQLPCAYCGKPPSQLFRARHLNGAYAYSGIDRLDNDRGYTAENTVPCCKQCNSAKGTLTFIAFKEWIGKVHAFLSGI